MAEWGTSQWFEARFRNGGRSGDAWGHRWRGSQKYRLRQALRLVAPVVVGGSRRVLDVGCAFGDFVAELRRLNPANRITAVDIAPTAVAGARAAYPGIRFVCGALPDLGFESGSFDVVVALEVVYYLRGPDRAAAFDEIARILRPGGRLLVSSVLDDGGRYFREAEFLELIRARFTVQVVRHNHARLYSVAERPLLRAVDSARHLSELVRSSDAEFEEWRRRAGAGKARVARSLRAAGRLPLGAGVVAASLGVAPVPIRVALGSETAAALAARLTARTLGDAGRTHAYVLATRKA